MKRAKLILPACLTAACVLCQEAKVELATVVARPIVQTVELPGEIQPFEIVSLHAKVRGYVEKVLVDRGSVVRQGQLLAELSAPEIAAQTAEAESKIQSAESERLEAEARLAGARSTYDRMLKAAETPGAVAGNELLLAQKQVEAASALVQSKAQGKLAAESSARAQKQLESYLRLRAPFNGVISERLIHPGALVGPGADPPLFTIENVSRLRLVVPVPEANVAKIQRGAKVAFRVPASPGRTYAGTIARVSHSLDEKTRTMAVEADVLNKDGSLSPGMYPIVQWKVQRGEPSLVVPKTSVVTTTERTFVVRDKAGKAEWVNVVKGATADNDAVEVRGDLHPGDRVVRRATDEIRNGAALQQ